MSINAKKLDRPKRILALDGGGIRGVLSLGVLSTIEKLYRQRNNNPNLVLSDEFDLFAGTSTGAIIASCLAWGMSIDESLNLYKEKGATMFKTAPPWQRHRAKYRADAIAQMFKSVFLEENGDFARLGSSKFKSMLLVVMRNASTGSPWPLTNNPDAIFNHPEIDGCNLDIPMWRILRASTAAPVFFPPEKIQLGSKKFTFIDGAITPYNNPSFIALLTATLPQYKIEWEKGVDKITLLSVGTGSLRTQLPNKPTDRLHLVDQIKYLTPALLDSVSEQQDLLCRAVGKCIFGAPIDFEIGDLTQHSLFTSENQICSYARFDPALNENIALDNVSKINELIEIGKSYAQNHITHDLLP